jgi:NADH:ubiquinone oxidoreductase subunit 6 (subunit J)
MELLFSIAILKSLLPLFAIITGIFVISTKNAIISVFNLIVLYILVAFYLIYIGMTYLGISYIIIYIGAIAILFLFIIMMIDIEVVEKRNNNYLPLLFLLLSGFFFSLKKIFYSIGLIKMKSVAFKEELVLVDNAYGKLFNIDSLSINYSEDLAKLKGNSHNSEQLLQDKNNDIFFQDLISFSSKNFEIEEKIYNSKEKCVPLFYDDFSYNTLSKNK